MNEREKFAEICRQPHRTMKRCFMTGKTCVYEEVIARHLQSIQGGDLPIEGFMIMAFRPNLNAFYNWSLVRFFKKYGADPDILKRADQVRRTGYVICEKICRRIQESAFVVADISINNKNVLYELGLAYGLRQKLLVVHDENSQTAKDLKNKFLPSDMAGNIYRYRSIEPIRDDESFVNRFYDYQEPFRSEKLPVRNSQIVVLELNQDVSNSTHSNTKEIQDDISLTFMDVLKGAVGISIDNIVRALETKKQLPEDYVGIIREMKTIHEICHPQNPPFETIRSIIDDAFCIFIRTSDTHQFSYFWLGYCHATGKNVIPIYDVEDDEDDVDDLAFDIRSLWHLTLVRKNPTRILSELEEILKQMILTDFSEWSRKSFWTRIFGHPGRVAIFTGALHNPDFKREMVGDWDLRTASELMSYFSTHQLMATIESPIYQPEKVEVDLAKYLKQIRNLIKDKNAIVIASADVNPLTELLLGQLYGVPDEKLFSQEFERNLYTTAVAAIKKRGARLESNGGIVPNVGAGIKIKRFFFSEGESSNGMEERGFCGNWLPGRELLEEFRGQSECKGGAFDLYAHMVVALNPFVSTRGSNNYVVILNGISGPSTFALTHLLTGGMGEEFVDYNEQGFNPLAEAESILMQINERLNLYIDRDPNSCGVQMIVKVTVGPPAKSEEVTQPDAYDQYLTFDSRRVKRWELVPGTLKSIRGD